MISNTRLYGAAIAFVSGGYSLWASTMGARMGGAGWLMLVLGLVVVVHGVVLLTDLADRLGDASGPLMILWSVLMLLNQAWSAWMGGMPRMGDGMMGEMPGSAMGVDAGMVALAVLMLVSGLIMTTRGGRESM